MGFMVVARSVRLLTVCGLAVVATPGCTGPKPGKHRPLEFTITCKDAKRLQVGERVVYKGVRIGVVRDITLSDRVAVVVRIDREHEERVCRESRFSIKCQWPVGPCRVEMKDSRCGRCTPMQPGDIVEATGILADVGENLKLMGEWARDRFESLWEGPESWADSPEGRAFKRSLEDFAEDASRLTAEQWEVFWRERYPVLKRKASALREKLEREGRSEEAREMWDDFETLAGEPDTVRTR